MDVVLALHADNTHLYPGARLTVPDRSAQPDRQEEALVLFSEHTRAEAVLTASGDVFVLQVEAYTTAAGTPVTARSWRLEGLDDATFVVRSRADP